jgi:hypothetical protein
MKSVSHPTPVLRVPLQTDEEQTRRLLALQALFAQMCNALAPLVQQTRVWERVALHRMAYQALRQQFPAAGSQLVCNAIYAVSRTCRLVFQNPQSPFHLSRLGTRPLPLLRFGDDCPVYFDRHTLSLKGGQLSMYTLDGRMRFDLRLDPQAERRFHEEKLQEVVLTRDRDGQFALTIRFAPALASAPAPAAAAAQPEAAPAPGRTPIPEFVQVLEP